MRRKTQRRKTQRRKTQRRRGGQPSKPILIKPRPLSLNEERKVRKISNNLEMEATKYERAEKAIANYEHQVATGKLYMNKPFWAYNIMAQKLVGH